MSAGDGPVLFQNADMGNPMTAPGQLIGGGPGGLPIAVTAGSSGQILQSFGATAPAFVSPASLTFYAPTTQKFTSTGVTAGAIFAVGAGGASAAVGAVYGNNGSTYLLLAAYIGGTFLFTGGTGFPAPISGLTLQLFSGIGSSGIGFATFQPASSYIMPSNPRPLYLRGRIAGGGGGGQGGGTSQLAGAAGLNSFFGPNWVFALGGQGGFSSNIGSSGGLAGIIGGGATGIAFTGGGGCLAVPSPGNPSGVGGANFFGGAGTCVSGGGSTQSIPSPNTGAGGGGGSDTASGAEGQGGAAGGAADFLIAAAGFSGPVIYAVGPGGVPGAGSTDGQAGATGAFGILYIEEFYQ